MCEASVMTVLSVSFPVRLWGISLCKERFLDRAANVLLNVLCWHGAGQWRMGSGTW